MKLGLFGGTFDPIHLGHMRCAEEIREIFDLDRIIFIPASRPPHKTNACITSFYHRERMIKLAIEGNRVFSFSDVENQRVGKSFSVETIHYFLKRSSEKSKLFFILGQDVFCQIKTWKDWKELLLLCNFVVMRRSGYTSIRLSEAIPADFASQFTYDETLQGFRGPTKCFIFIREVTLLTISASDIRQRLQEGQSIKYLVPDAVHRYIFRNSLYGV